MAWVSMLVIASLGALAEGARIGSKRRQHTKGQPLKILFVGNSFTYGPEAYDRKAGQLNNIPRFFKFVAESLGKPVLQQEDTLGGCTLWAKLPSVVPDGQDCSRPDAACQFVDSPRVNASEQCAIPAGISSINSNSAPCPQRLTRQAFGAWDVVVLQDWSNMLTIERARKVMLEPVFEEYAQVLKQQAASSPTWSYFDRPILASYSSWAYYGGAHSQCPGGTKRGCWPYGSGNDLSECKTSSAWFEKVNTVPCQTHSLWRGGADMLHHGADVVVPVGLAWQAVRGVTESPAACRAAIDAEYSRPDPLAGHHVPLSVDPRDASFKGALAKQLFTDKGPDYNSKYCDNCTIDHHTSEIGAYLTALVFYATLFGESPIGAAVPDGMTEVDGIALPSVSKSVGEKLQRIAHAIVLGDTNLGGASTRRDVWWKGGARP